MTWSVPGSGLVPAAVSVAMPVTASVAAAETVPVSAYVAVSVTESVTGTVSESATVVVSVSVSASASVALAVSVTAPFPPCHPERSGRRPRSRAGSSGVVIRDDPPCGRTILDLDLGRIVVLREGSSAGSPGNGGSVSRPGGSPWSGFGCLTVSAADSAAARPARPEHHGPDPR